MFNNEYLKRIIHKYTVDSSGAENAIESIRQLIYK